MKKRSASRRGRPPHRDDPPKLFATTLPESVHNLLDDLSKVQRRPKSEIITDAVRAYSRRIGLV
jgi:hypothetical protein